jgi:glycerol-3-phosphate dehydrogenase
LVAAREGFAMNDPCVLVLGGGINGAAAARELALNGVDVVLVDRADLAFGATAYSSRLIHGGLRYLEYGEFALVRESLDERARLLRLAPHLVHPLRLFIPVRERWSGLFSAAGRFLGLKTKTAERGLMLVRSGLAMYDWFARDPTLPKRSVHRRGAPGTPRTSPEAGPWLAAYSDAQITFPERMVVELLADAKRLAAEQGTRFEVHTYHEAHLADGRVRVEPVPLPNGPLPSAQPFELSPAVIVNATGAWVDHTLARLPVPSRRLMGGTKGSHLFTRNHVLRERLAGDGIYTEARDGRPVFILPFLDGALIGTTDIPYSGDPADAVASDEEIDYLIATVAGVFDDVHLTRDDIALHYCGVRPLPYVDARTTAAITRRHQLVWNDESPLPLVSLVGGKLTTCRSLAEETAAAVLPRMGKKVERTSRDRPIPRAPEFRDEVEKLADTHVPRSRARHAIEQEWGARLDDLVERRLMLLYDAGLSRRTLEDLAALLVENGRLSAADAPREVEACAARLLQHFGRRLASTPMKDHP